MDPKLKLRAQANMIAMTRRVEAWLDRLEEPLPEAAAETPRTAVGLKRQEASARKARLRKAAIRARTSAAPPIVRADRRQPQGFSPGNLQAA